MAVNSKDIFNNPLQDFEHYMALAFAEAQSAAEKGEVPVGAVVVYEPIDKATRNPLAKPKVIGAGQNRRETDKDASAHAEFIAMQQAMEHLDAWRLSDCTVYVTLEPCVMCAGLMQQARIARCVFGSRDPKGGALESLYHIGNDDRLNHSFEVISGIMEDECSRLLRDFFKQRRSTASAKDQESR